MSYQQYLFQLDVPKWATKVIQDALVSALAGGSFQDYIIKAMDTVLNQITVSIARQVEKECETTFHDKLKETYDRAFLAGRKSIGNDSVYDAGYKDGISEGLKQAESNRRWENFTEQSQ